MQQPITHRQNIIIRTQACELTDDIITLAISYVSEVGIGSSAKGYYVEVQKMSLETEQIASDVRALAYFMDWPMVFERPSRRESR